MHAKLHQHRSIYDLIQAGILDVRLQAGQRVGYHQLVCLQAIVHVRVPFYMIQHTCIRSQNAGTSFTVPYACTRVYCRLLLSPQINNGAHNINNAILIHIQSWMLS